MPLSTENLEETLKKSKLASLKESTPIEGEMRTGSFRSGNFLKAMAELQSVPADLLISTNTLLRDHMRDFRIAPSVDGSAAWARVQEGGVDRRQHARGSLCLLLRSAPSPLVIKHVHYSLT